MARSASKKINRWVRGSSSNCRSLLKPRRPKPLRNMHRILIVDDDSGVRESLRGVLEDEGYAASEVISGEACLDFLEKESVDLVLLDVWLPGIDGLDTLQ